MTHSMKTGGEGVLGIAGFYVAPLLGEKIIEATGSAIALYRDGAKREITQASIGISVNQYIV